MPKKTLSVKEFKEMYRISFAKAYDIVNRLDFPKIKIGRKYIILADKIDEYMNSLIGEVL